MEKSDRYHLTQVIKVNTTIDGLNGDRVPFDRIQGERNVMSANFPAKDVELESNYKEIWDKPRLGDILHATKPDSLQKYQGHENQGKTRNYFRLKETQQTWQLNRMGVSTGPFCRREWATPGRSRMRSEDWSVVMYQGKFLTSCLHRGHREECLSRNGILSFQRWLQIYWQLALNGSGKKSVFFHCTDLFSVSLRLLQRFFF